MLLNQMNEMRNMVDKKMGESNTFVQSQLGQSAKIIRDVTEKLVRLDETNKQVVNFADQLKSLQDILKIPSNIRYWGNIILRPFSRTFFRPVRIKCSTPSKTG